MKLLILVIFIGLVRCAPSYSPDLHRSGAVCADSYASNAAQQANKVEQGVVVGMRPVAVSAIGTIGTLSGAAAGGIAGSQVGMGPFSAFSALGGSLVGGLAGSTAEHVAADTAAFEYIVRKPNGDLVSVAQRDKTPLVVGQKVLVIAGVQARVVPDYTVPPVVLPGKSPAVVKTDATTPRGAIPAVEASAVDDRPGAAAASGAAPVSGGVASGSGGAASGSGDRQSVATGDSQPEVASRPPSGAASGFEPAAGSADSAGR